MEMADHLAQDGWRDLGYVYLNIDDCWIGGRDAKGNLVPDPKRFPNGIAFLADYVSPPPPCPRAGVQTARGPTATTSLRVQFCSPCLKNLSLVGEADK